MLKCFCSVFKKDDSYVVMYYCGYFVHAMEQTIIDYIKNIEIFCQKRLGVKS